ncbi:RNA-binding motif protein, X-linked 2-like isoform X1 [Montipora foliosa]|uniref:RNA-binding motif protein, X-linked 2-like isoform X1 n=1 Tax=Montipora foliosa TaxID=591990 RepID=UPI0035F1279E
MNPLTNVKNIQKLNERILELGVEDSQAWHKQYKDSAYIFIGGLPYGLTEGDILCVFSQYGEIVNVNLVRDKKTGKTKGFCFLCYEDQRSTILAVDNFNGIKLGGRTIRVDHCSNYRRPKSDEKDEHGNYKDIIEEGCAPKTPPPSGDEEDNLELVRKRKQEKKEKKKKKSKEKSENKKRKMESSSEEEYEKEKLIKIKLEQKERVENKTGDKDRDKGHSRGDHRDHEFGKITKRDGDGDAICHSRSDKHRDLKYKSSEDLKSVKPYRDNNRFEANKLRERTGNAYDTPHDERDLLFDDRRHRSDKQRDYRVNEERSFEKHSRSRYSDHRDRRT